ncbi:MAG TPA: hypothetical protein VF064_18705 [Pyrinomonadaceae bacterium]
MRDEHVKGILDAAPLAQLGEGELAAVRAHTARCAECLRAYEAARASSLLLTERVAAAAEVEMPPFFQTRVLAALRERRATEEAPALSRLWRAAGALVSSMAVTVAALVALTFTVPGTFTMQETTEMVAASDLSPDEAALLALDDVAAEDEIDYGQVLTTVYEMEDER